MLIREDTNGILTIIYFLNMFVSLKDLVNIVKVRKEKKRQTLCVQKCSFTSFTSNKILHSQSNCTNLTPFLKAEDLDPLTSPIGMLDLIPDAFPQISHGPEAVGTS